MPLLLAVTVLLCLWCAGLVYDQRRADQRRARQKIRRAARRARKRREAFASN